MVYVTLYQFNKKPNSTAIPSGGGTSFNAQLVENCSIQSPVLQIRMSDMTIPTNFNYARINIFSRYYFIINTTYNADLGCWTFYLKSDVLATAKTNILASTQFVERSFSRHNLMIPDGAYITDGIPQYSNTIHSNFFNATPGTGYYIIGVISTGANMSRFGGIQYYILSSSDMNALVNFMMGTDNYADASVTQISADLLGFLADPMQFIVSCKFIPRLDIITSEDTGHMMRAAIKFGAWESTVYGYRLPDDFINPAPVIRRGFSMQLTQHPQAVTRGGWLNGNKTTERVLRFEPWGLIPLDCNRLVEYENIYLDVAIDIITGDGILSIYAIENPSTVPANIDTLPLINSQSSSVLIDIPLAQLRHEGYLKMGLDMFIKPRENATTGALSGFASGGMAGALMGAAGGFVSGGGLSSISGMYEALQDFYGSPQSQGTPGSLLCRMPVIIFNKFMNLVSEDLAEFGRPLCSYTTLTNLTGYTKCVNANIATNLLEPEDREIESFLNSGFFIE